ncbi:MAG: hypothetical protein E7670_02425 [Ruminococcaceae bacterium]|nr:hypothetical protein [Oscillospiraceae bacterium]
MKKTIRSAMISTIAMLVVAVISLTGVTYAWFTQGTDATVSTFNVNVQAADGSLTIAIPGTDGALTWGTTITPFSATPANLLRPVSSVAADVNATTKLNFYHATVSTVDDTKLGTVTEVDSNITGEYANYYTFDFYVNNMGNGTTMNVMLKENSGFTGISAKALRIGFIQYGYMNATSFTDADEYNQGQTPNTIKVFEPNKDADHSALAQVNVANNGNVDTTYALSGIPTADTEAIYGSTTNKTAQVTFDDNYTSTNPTVITSVPANSVAKVTVVIWLEGQDVDCINEIASGTMELPIKLTAVFDMPAQG